ncbi:Glutathione import ATP-binding protein GsiA [Megamonas hypermegale]|uniref:Glutathione import ATP-binding protein GsiA n=1 Tax=Megamonas hypermegale TaxID=158847 RepID=A0A239TEP6_9FIRM|nr:ABC transporter ATP-binding protein [Megamonas hypermegale]SNU96049.1 Glutathione import ATP-binding protein GsiA [Megamonas hypermegale]
MLLQVKNLAVSFSTYRGKVKAVRDVSFSVDEGKTIGIVGESGCGKSVTSHAIMGLLPRENSKIEHGQITFNDRNITDLSEKEMNKLRGNEIAMIFQDPMTSLNPVLTIGTQIQESLFLHKKLTKQQARQRAIELLKLVGIPSAEIRLDDYPHQFSGGMRQRVMIAMALSCEPKLLIADEPTTALDVTVQAQILDLLKQLQRKMNTAIVLISHDLGVIANLCDDIAVMYAGQIVEYGSAEDIFYNTHHPYTKGLLKSLPRLTDKKGEPLSVIEGQPPDLKQDINFCPFAMRCDKAMRICAAQIPAVTQIGNHHYVKCWLEHELAPKGEA